MSAIYDNSAKLEFCEFPQLNMQVGVFVGEPYKYGTAETVEVSRETVSIGTRSAVAWIAAIASAEEALRSTQLVVKDIDDALEELNAHKYRLLQECRNLERVRDVREMSRKRKKLT